MPIYPPRNTPIRKKEILHKREIDFLKNLNLGCSLEKAIKLAEKVRVAKLNLIKARLALIQPFSGKDINSSNLKLKEKLEKEAEKWKSLTFEEISSFYR